MPCRALTNNQILTTPIFEIKSLDNRLLTLIISIPRILSFSSKSIIVSLSIFLILLSFKKEFKILE